MAGTYSQVLLHIVFSTKGRTLWIAPDVAERRYPFMGGLAPTFPLPLRGRTNDDHIHGLRCAPLVATAFGPAGAGVLAASP
jgi:hypothetical protein